MEEYRRPWWACARHQQTIFPSFWNKFFGRWPHIEWKRQRWETDDGDFIHVDWAGDEHAERLLVLFHGLEGSHHERYARQLAKLAEEGWWRLAFVNFRGCSGKDNKKCRAYHAGDSQEIDWILRRFADENGRVYAAGVSLGGNALLKWLGETDDAGRIVRRAASISAPFHLAAFSPSLSHGFNYLYSWYFLYLTSLRRKAFRILKRRGCKDAFDENALKRARTLEDFEDAVTAPLHGFKNKQDYWAQASAIAKIPGIRVPTLILNARNDPFLPEHVLDEMERTELPIEVTLAFPSEGGHAGFPGCNNWMARRVLEHFSQET